MFVLCVCRKGRCWFTRYLMSCLASTAGHPRTVSASWEIRDLWQVFCTFSFDIFQVVAIAFCCLGVFSMHVPAAYEPLVFSCIWKTRHWVHHSETRATEAATSASSSVLWPLDHTFCLHDANGNLCGFWGGAISQVFQDSWRISHSFPFNLFSLVCKFYGRIWMALTFNSLSPAPLHSMDVLEWP